MEFSKWDPSFSVGIKEIDDEHKKLLGLIEALYQIKDRDDREFVGRVLATLVDYINIHFYHEEQLLKNVKYPKFDEHHKQHQTFSKKIADFQKAFDAGESDLTARLLEYLKVWIATHILVHDKAYESYLKIHHKYT